MPNTATPSPDVRPDSDILTFFIQPVDGREPYRASAQLREGGWLLQPGRKEAVTLDEEPLKIGRNRTCTVTVL